MPAVGRNAPRKEGPDKLTGRARYVDDLSIPGCWHGVTVRSPAAAGRIRAIRFDPSFPWDQCVVATAVDVPGENAVVLLGKDQPLLAAGEVKHALEPVALIAHPSRETAYEALKHVTVEVDETEPVLTMDDALAAKRLVYGSDNVFKRFTIEKGDAKAGLAAAHKVVSGEYFVPHQEQSYIENQGMAAWFEPDGSLVVTGSLQCPYYVVKALAPLFALPESKVRVIQAVTGGGFGGKEEYPNMIGGHAALLARKAGRPVKIVYDRHEDLLATTKRHPARVRHRTGVAKDGRLVAVEIDIVMDGGAYMTLSPVVLSRGILHATGPYECPNVSVVARCVATNTPPNGAFRGFGAPQTLFAAELHWEKVADALGIDSLTLRRRNLVREGSVLSTGQVLKDDVGASDALEIVARRSRFEKRRKDYAAWNKKASNPVWKGIGLAVVHHGAGFTGNGEVYLASRADVALRKDGTIRLKAAASEMGQGSNSTLCQIVADALGVPYELVEIETPDTREVPNSGPTVASRTCMIVGGLLHRAALELKEAAAKELGRAPRDRAGLRKAARALCNGSDERRFSAEYVKPEDIVFDDVNYKGDAYGTYGYAALAVDLEIDKATCEVKVNRVWTAADIGKAIHPNIVEGQIMGGTLQALGWALLEEPVYKAGVMQNAQLTNYIIPTALDAPPMDVAIVERPYRRGPFGAKGVGEMPMDVPPPAVAAAVYRAVGRLIPRIPLTPERIAAALEDPA